MSEFEAFDHFIGGGRRGGAKGGWGKEEREEGLGARMGEGREEMGEEEREEGEKERGKRRRKNRKREEGWRKTWKEGEGICKDGDSGGRKMSEKGKRKEKENQPQRDSALTFPSPNNQNFLRCSLLHADHTNYCNNVRLTRTKTYCIKLRCSL